MKKIIIGGLAAGAIAMVPGVALAGPALADAHGFNPQQIQNVLQSLAPQAQQGGDQQQAATPGATAAQPPTQAAGQQQTPAQNAGQQEAGQQGQNQVRLFTINALAEGMNTSSQLAELDGPADRVFNGGHTPVGSKGPSAFQFSTKPGGLPGIVHAKWNFLDANNQVTDSVSMDMVVIQVPGQPPTLDLRNIRTGNTVQTTGKHFDDTGDVFDDFTQGP